MYKKKRLPLCQSPLSPVSIRPDCDDALLGGTDNLRRDSKPKGWAFSRAFHRAS